MRRGEIDTRSRNFSSLFIHLFIFPICVRVSPSVPSSQPNVHSDPSTLQLQLQPIRRNLKRPQLDIHTDRSRLRVLLQLQLLLIVLEDIALPDPLDGVPGVDGAAALAAQGLVDAEDDALPRALGELAARHVLVVLAALDRVEDERLGAREGDGFEGVGLDIAAGSGLQDERVVEVVAGADGAGVQGPRVRQDGVADVVAAHVRVGVGGLGRSEEGQAHQVAAGRKAVLGVVEDGDAVAVLGEVGPFVAADLESGHVPAVEISIYQLQYT